MNTKMYKFCLSLVITLFTLSTNLFAEATSAPTAPTHAEVDVVSVYSDSYTTIASNLNPGWGQSTTFTEEDFSGNKVMKYANLNYQGLEYNNTDISSMEYVHVDFYTDDATSLEFYLIAGGENAYDIAASSDFVLGQWVSIDIPLTFYSDAGRDLTAAYQFKTVGNGTVYFDNLYFWKQPTADAAVVTLADLTITDTTIADFASAKSTYNVDLAIGTTTVPTITATPTNANATISIVEATSIPGTTTITITSEDASSTATVTIDFTANRLTIAAPVPTNNATDVISIFSDEYTSIATNLNPSWSQATVFDLLNIDGNETMKYADLNYQGLEYATTDISSMEYLHIDYWTIDASGLSIYLIADGENAYDIAASETFATGQWVSLDIPLSYYSEAGRDLTAAYQFKMEGDGTTYFDNMYFWKEVATSLNNASEVTFSAYPNPITTDLTINFEGNSFNKLTLYNLAGQEVYSQMINNTSTQTFDMSNLETGIYMLQLEDDTQAQMRRVIKQ